MRETTRKASRLLLAVLACASIAAYSAGCFNRESETRKAAEAVLMYMDSTPHGERRAYSLTTAQFLRIGALYEAKLGTVESWQIGQIHVQPLLIPVLVEISTKRNGKVYREVFIRQGVEVQFSQWEVEDASGLPVAPGEGAKSR